MDFHLPAHSAQTFDSQDITQHPNFGSPIAAPEDCEVVRLFGRQFPEATVMEQGR